MSIAVAALIFALLAGAPTLHAQKEEGVRKYKKELETQIKKLNEAVEALADTDEKIRVNIKDQRAAASDKDKLAKLKREGNRLAERADEERKVKADIELKIAGTRIRLRIEAAKSAVAQLSGNQRLDIRVEEALFALEAWKGAVTALPQIPDLRTIEHIKDPAERNAIRNGDRTDLKKYIEWVGDEETRLKSELDSLNKLIDAKEDLAPADNGNLLVTNAEGLKKTLESRQKQLKQDKSTAKTRLKKAEER